MSKYFLFLLIVIIKLNRNNFVNAERNRSSTTNSTMYTDNGTSKTSLLAAVKSKEEAEEMEGMSTNFKYAHIGSSVGIPVGEALDPPLCPPPPLTRSLGICYLKKCSTHHDCEKGEACCFNGCIHTCIKPMDRPAAFDWVEDTDRILPILDLEEDEPSSNFVPILVNNRTSQYEEALGRGELVHLPGGCFISASSYEELKKFMQAPSIKTCRCNEGEVVCDINIDRS